MEREEKMMGFMTVAAIISSLMGYFLALPYVTICAVVCLAISGVGMMISQKK